MASFSDHVSNCPHFLEASYWCPSCGQMEHLGVDEYQDGSITINPSNKGSKLKRVGDLFKRFCCPNCKNPPNRLHRRHGAMTDSPAELQILPAYPHGKAEIDSNHDTEPSLGGSMAMKTPLHPESPDNIGCCELEGSCGRESSGRSSTKSISVRNVRCPDENGWDSKSPTRQEVEDSNLKHLGASDPGTVIERAKTSSHGNVNSQRKSRTGLGLSTPDRPLENSPPVDSHEQIGASNSSTSQITPGSAIAGSLYRPPREVSLIWRVDDPGEVVDHPRQQTLEAQELSTRAQVKRLRQVLRGLNDQWKGYLDHGSETSRLLAGLNNSPLNDGLEALAQFFSGSPPTTFGGVFILVQLAYACACIYHNQETLLGRSSFHQNAIRWGERITDLGDRCRFFETAHLLWQVPPQDRSDFLNHTSDLQTALTSGAVIRSCVCFLDGKV